MCGIIGYVGKGNALNYLKNGLKTLEYRGYDSAGISFFENNKIVTIKNVGNVGKLIKKIPKKTKSDAGIGHTRWATHGKANIKNCHPHTSHKRTVNLVHNGIIENYLELKNTYLKNIKLYGETDSEIVANLIEQYYLKKCDKLKSIHETVELLKGSYALAIIFADEPNTIYFAKHTSPLCIGITNNGKIISSDILGFCNEAKKYYELKDGEFGRINKENFEIFDKNGKKIDIFTKNLTKNAKILSKNKYKHYMKKEIYEIPKVILDTTKTYLSKNNPLKKIKKDYFDFLERVRLIACGTSYHACLVCEKFLREYGFDASCDIASEFIYSPQVLSKNTLCIFVSQSGETADTISAVKLAKSYGAKTIAITNVETSNITKICDYVLPIKCGAEIAVASTKAYVAQLVVLKIFANFLKR